MSLPESIAAAVSADTLWDDLCYLAQLGARPDGGVGRLALDTQDIAARRWLVTQGRALGASAHTDGAGNLFLRLAGKAAHLPPVVTGSHIDSQPAGGAYDGAYGVLAGLAVLRALHSAGVVPERSIEVVAWTNEEGVRFSPGTSGSSCFTGRVSLADTRAIVDDDGVSFGTAVDACTADLMADEVAWRELGTPMHAFLELHIEQGPVLEQAGLPLGVVTGIQGVSWFRVTVSGKANHAGTTPRSARADAFAGAMELASVLREIARDEADETRFTIGRFQLSPDSINTIPDQATFTIDLRHPDPKELDRLEVAMAYAIELQWAGCDASMERLSRIDPVAFPDPLVATVAAAAETLGMPYQRMNSGAFHDAIHLASHCPTGMLFIPCKDGLSHHPAESITQQQATDGARALAAAVMAVSVE